MTPITCPNCPGSALAPTYRLPGQRAPRYSCPRCGNIYRVRAQVSAFTPSDGGRDAGGYSHESSDCSVRAWAIAAGLAYAEAHAAFKAAGREDRKGTLVATSVVVMGPITEQFFRCDQPTLARWLRAHPSGRYVVHIARHAMAVVDGLVIDGAPPGPMTRVHRYWLVE